LGTSRSRSLYHTNSTIRPSVKVRSRTRVQSNK
jgi:hypothetical protein